MPRARQLVSTTERIIYLRSIPVGGLLSPPVLNMIASYLIEHRFGAGDEVMREGEPYSGMHFLIEGSLELAQDGQPLGVLRPPQTLGFLGILAQTDGTSTAIAPEDVRTLELETDALLELLEDHFELLSATLDYFCQRLYYELSELPAEVLTAFLAEEVGSNDQAIQQPVERLLFLRELRPFANSNLNALLALTRGLRYDRVAAGDRLWSRHQAVAEVVIPVDGALVATCATGEFTVGSGAVLGAVEAGGGLETWFDLDAPADVSVLRGPMSSFLDLFEDHFQIGLDFIAMLASDLLRALSKKRELGAQDPLAVRRDVSRLGSIPVGA